jgi:membrane protein implicated in regulation of membrane protease activity
LPILALPVFWLAPLSLALPAYGLVLAAALWVYALAFASSRRRPMTGAESMLGERGRVVRIEGRTATLLIHGELWSTESDSEALAVGDSALVVGIEGLRLRAKRTER